MQQQLVRDQEICYVRVVAFRVVHKAGRVFTFKGISLNAPDLQLLADLYSSLQIVPGLQLSRTVHDCRVLMTVAYPHTVCCMHLTTMHTRTQTSCRRLKIA